MRLLDDLKIATVFLTRVPVLIAGDVPPGRIAGAMWAFPLIGLVHGAFGGLVYWGTLWATQNPFAAAALALALMIWATGAFHEDGLADTFDGLGGGLTRDRKLEIMRDSRIGSYGAAALVTALLLKAALIAALPGPAAAAVLAGSGALSRACAVLVAQALPHAAGDGKSKDAGRPDKGIAGWAAFLGIAAALAAILVSGLTSQNWLAMLPVAAAWAAAAAIVPVLRHQIGGQTGDTLGATQQLCEIVFLLALAALAAHT
jgi:adenosylcobinamide-GDP ribazoletransferase